MRVKDPSLLKTLITMSVHLAVGHDLCSIGLTCCEVTIGKLQVKTYLYCMYKITKGTCYWS